MNRLARALANHRNAQGLPQAAVAKQLGITPSTYNRIERGMTKPYNRLAQFARYLGVTADEAHDMIETPVSDGGESIHRVVDRVAGDLGDLASTVTGRLDEVAGLLREVLQQTAPPAAGMVAAAVQARREIRGMTVDEAALIIGVEPEQLARIEQGVAGIAAYATRVARFLDADPEQVADMLRLDGDGFERLLAGELDGYADTLAALDAATHISPPPR